MSVCAISRPRKRKCHLGLVPFCQKANQIPQLDLIVAFIGAGTKLYFLDLDLLLLALRNGAFLFCSNWNLP